MFPISRKVKSKRVSPQKYTTPFLTQMNITYPGNGLRNAKRIATDNIKYLSNAQASKVQSAEDIVSTQRFWENVLGLLNKV